MPIWPTVRRLDSANVWKYVFQREDAVAEAVLYRYPNFEKRTVICCSTQSGCPVGCRFCGSGDYFNRNLRSEEIYEQIRYALADHEIDTRAVEKLQFMFMSMGEPLLNWDALAGALQSLHASYPNAQLLISTMGPDSGVWGDVRSLSRYIPTIGLQFSVHESTDEKRNALIPFKHKLTLAEIAREGVKWYFSTGRRPFFNYCAHTGNTSDADAVRLADFFDPKIWECTVSVVCEREEHVAAANERQRDLASGFMSKMLERGFSVRMFDPAGQDDIGGGCGQLWFVQEWMRNHPDKARKSIGNGLPVVHTPK